MFRFFLLALCLWLTASFAHARESLPLDTGNTTISLVSGHDSIVPGESFTVALRMKFDGNWYTYWRNAGDSGEPVNIIWDLPEGVTAGPIQWPTPTLKSVGPIVSYAMAGDVWLPVEISVDETVNPSQPITLRAHAYFLVCDDICIPEDGALSVPLGVGSASLNPEHDAAIKTAASKVPQIGAARGSAELENGKVIFNLANLPKGFDAPQLFPNENPIIIHSDPIEISAADQGLQFRASAGYGWDEGVPASFDVTFVAEDGRAIVVPIATDNPIDIGPIKSGAAATPSITGFFGAALGAFLGGLILNLMPCVFPIISLKALSLAKTAHGERSATRRSAWAYTAGVLFSFLIFAGGLIALKFAGASVGWGFQLQSPWVVALLSLLLFAIGLNLMGVFDIGGQLQNLGAGSVNSSGHMPSFLTGVLAVIVATPCTAPFMAGAVGIALTGSAIVTLIIFLALGVGFALPFLLVAYVPGLLSRLPKPGAWMESFKQLLAFPMFAAAIWLAWVLTLQAGAGGILKLLLAALALAFAIWALRKNGAVPNFMGGVSLIFALILPLTVTSLKGSATLKSQSWSAQAVAMAQSTGRPVFVDFTAAWCVTCKVNEGLVIKTEKTAQLFEETNTVFLVADWTKKDDVIAAELKRHGRAGVPLYLVYKPGQTEPQILPQILTHQILEAALN